MQQCINNNNNIVTMYQVQRMNQTQLQETNSFQTLGSMRLEQYLLKTFQEQLVDLLKSYEQFKQQAMNDISVMMGKVMTAFERQKREKAELRVELLELKKVQFMMKEEVVQLKEMMSAFMAQAQNNVVGQEQTTCLETIQEQTSVVFSSIPPSFRDQTLKSIENISVMKEENKSNRKNRRTFLDHFRKTIVQSALERQRIVSPAIKIVEVDNWQLTEADGINLPKKFQTPKNIMFLKNKEERVHTQQSPNRMKERFVCSTAQKVGNQSKFSSLDKKESSNLSKRSLSKSKIHLSIKDSFPDVSLFTNKNRFPITGVAFKPSFKKLIRNLKTAIEKYVLWQGTKEEEIKNENFIKGLRQKKDRIMYKNGIIYEGETLFGMKHGKGKFEINGVRIFQGQWHSGKAQGQCQIISLKMMSLSCSKMLQSGSYEGCVFNGRFHGNGTIFLSRKDKILSRFKNGVPYGQFTFYNAEQISIGLWPTD